MTRLLIVLLAVAANPSASFAGGCYQKAFVKSYAVAVAPVVQQYYFVGAPIRAEAIVEAEMKSDPEYQDFLDFKAWKAGKQAPPAVPDGALAAKATVIDARCIRCHSGPEPKGGHDFTTISPDELKLIKEILPTGAMPPPKSEEAKGFTNELAGQLLLDAIDRLEAASPDDPPPAPPEEAPPLPPEEPPPLPPEAQTAPPQ